MKTLLVMVAALVVSSGARAQTFAEWFNQKKTQKKYLIEQIAALKVYGGYLKSGYGIAKKGLGLIGEIKDGDFGLHSFHFNSLKNVNAEIRSDPQVDQIIKTQQFIGDYCAGILKWVSAQSLFTADEKAFFQRVYGRLETDCLATLDELEIITRSGKVEMTDEQRLSQLEKLNTESLSQLRFAKSFGVGLQSLVSQKDKELKELKNSRTWYGQK